MPHATARAGRAITGIALIACLLSQLTGMVHLATVRHVACAEHGGVVELHASRDGRAERTPLGAVVAEVVDAAHHAHCGACTTPPLRGAAPSPSSLRAPSSPRDVAAARTHPTPAIALLSLAPKSSPPA